MEIMNEKFFYNASAKRIEWTSEDGRWMRYQYETPFGSIDETPAFLLQNFVTTQED